MSPVRWFEVGDSSIFGPEIIYQALEKVRVIREKFVLLTIGRSLMQITGSGL